MSLQSSRPEQSDPMRFYLQRGVMSPCAQKSRYPRSRRSCQSANSSQKANRPSSGKQKMSSSSLYTNSEMPFSQRYISSRYTRGHSSSRSERAIGDSPGSLLRKLIGLRVHTLAVLRGVSIRQMAHFLGSGALHKHLHLRLLRIQVKGKRRRRQG